MADPTFAIRQAAAGLGFQVSGITSVEPLSEDYEALLDWCEAGNAAGMEYMTSRTELHGQPGRLVPNAASLITLAVNYYAADVEFDHGHRRGRVARYAWGKDYHDVVKPRLAQLGEAISQIAGHPVRSRGFVDAVPLLERAAAARSGIGFFGKNTNLLDSRRGSWFFLAELFVDLELPSDSRRVDVSCGTCHRCLDACPTGAFTGPYVLDSRRCISYLTIENKGPIPIDLRSGLGEWVFGCDVCQDVCPFNRFSSETGWDELRPEAGVGPALDLVSVLSIENNEDFRARFRGTALLRPRRRGLLRNAAVVAANIGCTAAVPVLVERVERDPEPLIRGHALWALSKLDRRQGRLLADRLRRADPDEWVRDEAETVLSERV